MQRLAIQRIGLASACKFGFILGILLSIPAGIVGAGTFKALAAFFRALLESWQKVNLGLVQVNLTNLLGLDPILRALRDWDALTWVAMLAIVIAASIAGGVMIALMATLVAATYNLAARLSGGIEIETRARDAARVAVAPRAWLMGAGLANGFALQTESVRIGSAPTNQLVLSGLAPVHAEIVRIAERWVVRDLGAPSGTFVNDRPIRENMLKDGFRVRFGNVELVFREIRSH